MKSTKNTIRKEKFIIKPNRKIIVTFLDKRIHLRIFGFNGSKHHIAIYLDDLEKIINEVKLLKNLL